jgi:hypothetical protein
MRIGYARVSAQHQNLDRQLATLKTAGCKQIFKEKQSGREGVKRPQLEKAIDALGRVMSSFSENGTEQQDQCLMAFALSSGSPRVEPH